MAKDVFVLVCVALCLQLALCQFGFFSQREDRRFNVFGAVQDILENPRRTLQAVLNFGPDRNQNRPGTNGQYYDQLRPNYPNFNPNEHYYNNIRYPNRDFNNGRDIVFEPTNNPFQNYPNEYFNTRPNEEYTNENPDVPNFGNNNNDVSIPSADRNGQHNFINNNIPNSSFNSEGNKAIPTAPSTVEENLTPVPQLEPNNNGIPVVPPTGLETNGIPTASPPGVEENNITPAFISGNGNNGIPDVPPTGLENNNGIPTSPPIGFTDKNLGSDSSVTEALTTLAPLTPVPNTGSRNNLNFGSEGLFCN